MTPDHLLADLEARGVTLSERGRPEGLRVDAPVGVITPELRAAITEHKADLIQLLFEREERAALMGGMTEQGDADDVEARAMLQAAADPSVREVLKIFGGEIVAVWPLEGEARAA
jgi:hypothetical protein